MEKENLVIKTSNEVSQKISLKKQKSSYSKVAEIREHDFANNSNDDFTKLFEQTFVTINENEIISGTITAIETDSVFINVGHKSEGIIPITEFKNISELNVGDSIEVFVEKSEDVDGGIILSRTRADFVLVWKKILATFENNEIVKGKVIRRVKGGLIVDLLGIETFLPGSQVDIHPVSDFDAYIDKELDIKIVKINHALENVVVSHKVLMEEEMAEHRQTVLETLEKGQVIEGIVKAITGFGVFVDLGGIDGLIHITDLSWGRVNSPNDIVSIGQKVQVAITELSEDKKRISLGMKQLTSHPWENIEEKFPLRMKVSGKIVSLTDYGAFIEIEKGIEGLVHISEMSWTQHIKKPAQFISLGQNVEAIVVELNKEEKKLALSIKQLEPDPWIKIMEKFKIGTTHTGIIKSITAYGAFVELENGIDGLVHISDLSWTKKIKHPSDIVKKGNKINVIVIDLNYDERKISLGHKQLLENPWENLETIYKVGMEVDCKISRAIEKGIIVELPNEVDGFIPASHLSQNQIKDLNKRFKTGETISAKIIEFDAENRRIVLSVLDYLKDKEQSIADEYSSKFNLTKIKASEVVISSPDEEVLETEKLFNFPDKIKNEKKSDENNIESVS